jgi:hypothetical protein
MEEAAHVACLPVDSRAGSRRMVMVSPAGGQNTFDEAIVFGGVEYLVADFDAVTGQEEAGLSVGDSGGGAFIFDEGVWKLAGINYSLEAYFDTNNVTGDGSEFMAALYDKGGYYLGNDSQGYTWQPDLLLDTPSQFYLSSISASATQIMNITGVPEPGSALLVLVAACCSLQRRRRI